MEQPYISADRTLPELTPKAIVLSSIMALIFAASNTYLGLKVGLIISASIPAAVVAMVLFRFSKSSNILENNLVQTATSASAAIASGIVFVVPALLIIHFWSNIDYWETVFVCLAGGTMGILFSIPLRRAMLSNPELRFPEGRAIAEVLKVNETSTSLKDLLWGGLVGAVIQLCQQGFQIMSSAYMIWHRTSSTIIGTGMGFDISMIGAGYIIGFSVGVSMILGACVGWIFGIPILAFHLPGFTGTTDINDYVMGIWTSKIRYLGIGTMLVGGLWSLVVSMKPIIASLKSSYQATRGVSFSSQTTLPRTERDIPLSYTLLSIAVLLVLLGFYIFHELARMDLSLSIGANLTFIISTVLYLLIGGFVFSAIAAYFSGLVGMSASPVSAINIAILILISLLLSAILNVGALRHDTPALILHAAAISIIITAVLACAACMCNGTIQDLKTGEILGATPWKLQTSLIIGVALSTLVVPPVVELLFNAYGMGGVFPRPDMDKSQVLGAPQASLIAAVAQGMFLHNMPMHLILIGVVIGIVMILFNAWLSRVYNQKLSLVAFAIGIYLPMAMTFPIFVGSLVSLFINRHIKKVHGSANTKEQIAEGAHSTTLIACGLVAGGAIMGLLISIPFALEGNTQALSLVPASFAGIAAIISIITTFLVCYWMYRTGIRAARG